MGIFKDKDNSSNNQFSENDIQPHLGKINAEADTPKDARFNGAASSEQSSDDNEAPQTFRLGDKGITQIASINQIAKANGWEYSVEFSSQKVNMFFDGANYRMDCRGLDYTDDSKIPAGTTLAEKVKKATAKYDQNEYIFQQENSKLTSNKLITEDDIKQYRAEAAEIRSNLDGLIHGLAELPPKTETYAKIEQAFAKRQEAAKPVTANLVNTNSSKSDDRETEIIPIQFEDIK